MAEPKKLKVGVSHGGGPQPGYVWSVLILGSAFDEADSFLSPAGYKHLEMQMKELAGTSSPSQSPTVDVQSIEDFYELRDKGGPLGNINVRLFFGIDHDSRSIVVLGVIHKKNDHQTPRGDRVRMRNRWRKYRAGEFGSGQAE